MSDTPIDAVTGAFGFSGQYIAERLLENGRRVKTMTNHPRHDHVLSDRIETAPLHFKSPHALVDALRGVDTLYNTYWIRFEHGRQTFARAVDNTRVLVEAAKEAGVRRVVHVSITNPSINSTLPYFSGKAEIEAMIAESGLSHAIIRPTVIFGPGGILINNIAWLLRRMPVFGIVGLRDCSLQPIFVEDLAEIAVEAGSRDENETLDAVGPDIFTLEEMTRLIAEEVGSNAWLMHTPVWLSLLATGAFGLVLGDVVMTSDEAKGLLANLLISEDEPTGSTRLVDWLRDNMETVGTRYLSELKLHYR